MAKRFVDPNWKELRKLSGDLQRAWFYIWDKADEAGVYSYDPDYLKLDLGLEISLQELATLPNCEILPGERIFIRDFISVMYVKLKVDYNPHKPAFRAIAKNGLTLNLSLNEACFKLEEEGEDEDEEEQGGAGGSEQEASKLLVPQMLSVFKEHLPNYGPSKSRDFPHLYEIAQYLSEQIGSGPPLANTGPVMAEWRKICEYLSNPENFYHTKSLKTISTHIQEIFQRHEQPKRNSKKNGLGPKSGGFGILNEVERQIGLLRSEDD